MTEKTTVTRPFLPLKEEFLKKISEIFDTGVLTNQGPQVSALQEKLKSFLGVENFHYVTNGTVALQLALKALGIESGEVITTPFSYVATTSSILWERCKPVFVDIEPKNFTLDPAKIEAAITPETKAIMPVHVFGYACDVDAIRKIADRHGLKVIYDAAHAFASVYKGKALASYGDIATLSFHATKLFHTIEGGACVVKEKSVSDDLDLIKRFGHDGDSHCMLGINAKQDEFNAAMGLVNFGHLKEIIAARRHICELYDSLLENRLQRPAKQPDLEYNYAYYPVIFKSEKDLLSAFKRLAENNVFPRRYFYPSLNTLPYLNERYSCPVSEDISSRIACLPLYVGLKDEDVKNICRILKDLSAVFQRENMGSFVFAPDIIRHKPDRRGFHRFPVFAVESAADFFFPHEGFPFTLDQDIRMEFPDQHGRHFLPVRQSLQFTHPLVLK